MALINFSIKIRTTNMCYNGPKKNLPLYCLICTFYIQFISVLSRITVLDLQNCN